MRNHKILRQVFTARRDANAVYACTVQDWHEALQMQRDRATRHKYEILLLKRLVIWEGHHNCCY